MYIVLHAPTAPTAPREPEVLEERLKGGRAGGVVPLCCGLRNLVIATSGSFR